MTIAHDRAMRMHYDPLPTMLTPDEWAPRILLGAHEVVHPDQRGAARCYSSPGTLSLPSGFVHLGPARFGRASERLAEELALRCGSLLCALPCRRERFYLVKGGGFVGAQVLSSGAILEEAAVRFLADGRVEWTPAERFGVRTAAEQVTNLRERRRTGRRGWGEP